MAKKFKFKEIGKELPYTTPEGFFNKMEEQIWERVKDSTTLPLYQKQRPLRLWVIAGATGIAASLALLFMFDFSPFGATTRGLIKVEQAYANLTQEDQTLLLELYSQDLFINQDQDE